MQQPGTVLWLARSFVCNANCQTTVCPVVNAFTQNAKTKEYFTLPFSSSFFLTVHIICWHFSYHPFLRECSKKMFLLRGWLQEMRNCRYEAWILSKSVKNTKLIESIECFFCLLFLDMSESCYKKTHWSVISVAKIKGKQTDRIEIEGKQF